MDKITLYHINAKTDDYIVDTLFAPDRFMLKIYSRNIDSAVYKDTDLDSLEEWLAKINKAGAKYSSHEVDELMIQLFESAATLETLKNHGMYVPIISSFASRLVEKPVGNQMLELDYKVPRYSL